MPAWKKTRSYGTSQKLFRGGGFRMFFFVNLLGLVVFLGIGVLASRNRKEIQWRSVA